MSTGEILFLVLILAAAGAFATTLNPVSPLYEGID
jgi:hypothetical protein